MRSGSFWRRQHVYQAPGNVKVIILGRDAPGKIRVIVDQPGAARLRGDGGDAERRIRLDSDQKI
jgi:hypothetical protein